MMNGFSPFNRIIGEVGNGYHFNGGGTIMKKTGICILTAAAVWAGVAVSVLAAGLGNGRNYADRDGGSIFDNFRAVCRYADGDNICDNYAGNVDHGMNVTGNGGDYVDEDGDGVCDNYETVCRYIDGDGDNICDNCGLMYGNGCGVNYVDEDGDGVCDNYAGNGCGRSGGRGNGFGRGRRR